MMSVRKPDSDESGEAELKRMLLRRIVELESKIEGVPASLSSGKRVMFFF
jgi:hypothetical protein